MRSQCMELCGGGPRFWAWPDDAMVLEAIEAQEINADELLSEIAERVNFQAAA